MIHAPAQAPSECSAARTLWSTTSHQTSTTPRSTSGPATGTATTCRSCGASQNAPGLTSLTLAAYPALTAFTLLRQAMDPCARDGHRAASAWQAAASVRVRTRRGARLRQSDSRLGVKAAVLLRRVRPVRRADGGARHPSSGVYSFPVCAPYSLCNRVLARCSSYCAHHAQVYLAWAEEAFAPNDNSQGSLFWAWQLPWPSRSAETLQELACYGPTSLDMCNRDAYSIIGPEGADTPELTRAARHVATLRRAFPQSALECTSAATRHSLG